MARFVEGTELVLELESKIKATDTNTVKIGNLEVMKEDLGQGYRYCRQNNENQTQRKQQLNG